MARATTTKISPPPPPPTITRVTLELSYEEALAVLDLCGRVSGIGPRRNATSDIYNALVDAGLPEATERGGLGATLFETNPMYVGSLTFAGELPR